MEQEPAERSSPRRINPVLVILGAIFIFVAIVGFRVLRPEPQTFRFISADHPIDMWSDGSDKWVYYFIGLETTADLAKKARAELATKGFVEDRSQSPWYCFSKGKEQIVICNHHEFAVNGSLHGSKLVHQSSLPGTPTPTTYSCILVKNGPGTETPQTIFTIKKFILRW